MALGEEKAELEAPVDTKSQSFRRWSLKEQEKGPEPEQPPCQEAEGGPASPVCRTEGQPALSCWAGADPSNASGIYLPQASVARRAVVANGPRPALGVLLPPAITGTGDLLHPVGSQMEETKLSASRGLPQTVNTPRTTALCSGHNADTEDDPSPVDSPQVPGLSQQPPISGAPFPSQRRSMVSSGAAAPRLCSPSVSASPTGSSLQGYQEKGEPLSGSLAKVSSSLELAVSQEPHTVGAAGPRLQWSPHPVASGGDTAGPGRRHLSFQTEYWACVLPNSLPPSPDRHSPLWNPNKEYEDLLDYTYPLRPGPRLPKQLDSHMVADPVLQDSGIDLDSFSVSPASTLKSPINVSPNCPLAEAPTLPFSGPREPGLKQWPSRIPQKWGSMGLAPWSQLSSTPKGPGHGDAPWKGRETALRGVKDWPPMSKHPKVPSLPQVRTRDRGWPSPRTERDKRASQSVFHPTCMESGWKLEEVEESDEYLALPTRLTQVSSLVSYLGTLPTGAAEGQSSFEVSDSNGPASFPSDSSQSQLPSGAAFQRSGASEGQNLHNFVCAQDSAGEDSLVNNQALRVSSGLLKSHPSPTVLDKWPFSDPDAEGHLLRKAEEQRKDSLVQCVQTFCCQLEELIHWLYNVTDVTDLGTPPQSSLTGLKSSLQFYRQFKRDIHEHQSLTESVLEKGETLLQCLLDSTPVLKDVLGRISKQSGELESHADRLYDSILASMDMLAGCSLIPDNKPVAATEPPHAGV
ncbi:Centrosomal protein of 68 kDa [Heterocephalus glaber]|uniref:Centrosomal protein of 68 kDa n=1 Tax=Heterocephalus glaber TaxID=10181 RepID=G5C5Z2_HETGA|nr:centrosomal protein of 68 kDa isoform X1 [Heterocephalus glaber]XP_004850020.1 centrosomal protein of 68 kDa isoform X1 [Heterocephalus glaber]EHB16953.1 Centrosomal protein of 68 kDa [Heterocephalus glaber]